MSDGADPRGADAAAHARDALRADAAPPSGLPEKYTIVRVLGVGGMGTVYEARDATLDRRVALKVLGESSSKDPAFVERFLSEARTVARLNHPSIVQVFEFGAAGPRYFLAMEYVDGPSFADQLAKSGRLDERQVVAVARQACVALSVAHAAGIVHRDVKPDNMMRTSSGQFKLVDLGLAKRVDEERSKTGTGVAMGTPYYISPEQIRGDPAIDGRTDIYSLGAAVYQLATGRIPFEGTTGPHVMSRHLSDPLPDPRMHVPELSESFCLVVTRMMAKDPRDRYQNALELDADLAALEAGRVPPRAAAGDHGGANDGAESESATSASLPRVNRFRPVSATPRTWPPGELAALEAALARCVGPLAHMLVTQASRTAASREDLCHALADQVPSDAARKSFLAACGVTSAATPQRGEARPKTHPTPGSGLRTTPPRATGLVPAATAPAPTWDAGRVAALTSLLAAHVGPVARVLVRRAIAESNDADEVVAALAAHVDDPTARETFTSAARRGF